MTARRSTAAARFGRGLGLGAEPAAAGDPVLGGEGEPGGEVVFGGPPAEVRADLGDQLEGPVGGDAIDLREVHAGQVVERGADVDVGFVPVAPGDARVRERRRRGRGRGGQGLERRVDGRIAAPELLLTHVKEREILLQDKEVFGAVVAGQGGGDLGQRRLAVWVAVLGEGVRVVLASDEVAEDLEAGDADDVADHAPELEVHLDQRLLHAPHMGASGLDEDLAVAQVGAEGEPGAGGAEAPAQQAHAVQLAQPLTILDVALAAGHVFDVAGVDEEDLQAPGFEDVEERDPVHPGGFHGDARHAAGDEPVGEPLEVCGERPKGLNGGGVPIGRDRHEVLRGAAVDARDIDLDPVEHGGRPTSGAGGPAAFVLHDSLLHTAMGIRDQGGDVESILLNGITHGVSPVTKPRLPGPHYNAGLRVAPVCRSASGPGCSPDSRQAPPPARSMSQFLA